MSKESKALLREEWRQSHCDERYLVSSHGRVKSFAIYPKGVILKGALNECGYPTACLGGKSYTIHRLVATAFGIIKGNEIVNHKDGIRNNNLISNLEKSDFSHNMYHAYRDGFKKAKRGQTSNFAVLTDKKAKEIIKLDAKGETSFNLAKKFNVAHSTIRRVVRGITWRNLNEYRAAVHLREYNQSEGGI